MNSENRVKINAVTSPCEHFSCEGSEEFVRGESEKFYRAITKCIEVDIDGDGFRDEKSMKPATWGVAWRARGVEVEISGTVRGDWKDIIRAIQSGALTLHVGDIVESPLEGYDVDFVVTDEDAETLRFESRDCLGEYVPATDMRDRLNALWDRVPTALQEAIVETKRPHRKADGTEYTDTEKLFWPAAPEIFPEEKCYGDKGLYRQLKWYKDIHNRIRALKKGDDESDWYWTSTPRSGNSTYWCLVYYYGYADYYAASNTDIGAPVCFRISKSKNPAPLAGAEAE